MVGTQIMKLVPKLCCLKYSVYKHINLKKGDVLSWLLSWLLLDIKYKINHRYNQQMLKMPYVICFHQCKGKSNH